ncbi:MAG: tyrosine-type recombinase/integrase [Phototrophicaceae bacterium]
MPSENEIQPYQVNDLTYAGQDALKQAFRESQMGNDWLIPASGDKNHLSRLSLYVEWLYATHNHWTSPSLVDYAHYLQSEERGLSASSIKSHLSTIRARYRDLIQNPNFKQKIRAIADAAYQGKSESDRRVLYLTVLEDIQDALNPNLTDFLKTTTHQDRVDSSHVRLTASQAESLIAMPSIRHLMGLRDTALIYLLLATGLREAEVCALNVDNLRQRSTGELGVYVRHGKGAKARFVPYGELSDCLIYVDAWLKQTNITSGAVFRGFKDRHTPYYKPNEKSPVEITKRLTPRLTPRAVQNTLKQYPVNVDGNLVRLRPHDTRRTYAKLLWDNGMDLLAIRDNLGHADVKTTQGYIGDMNMAKRRAPAMLRPSHNRQALQQML